MKSFLDIEQISKTEVLGVGKDKEPILGYPEAGLADMFARWLILVSDGKQNKYVNCVNWEKETKLKDKSARNINDLTPDAQAFVFTLVQLAAATESNAMVPATDKAALCMVENYNVPKNGKIEKILKYSHKVGLSDLLAEKDKFVAETKAKFKVDPDMILSPAGFQSFLDELEGCGPKFDTTACVKDSVYNVLDLAGYLFDDDCEMYETTLVDSSKISLETVQILGITCKLLKGLGRKQEADTDTTLLLWLAGKQKEEEKTNQ